MIIYQPLSLLYMNNKFPSPTDHLQRQELLLRMEYEFEKKNSKGRLKPWVSPAR